EPLLFRLVAQQRHDEVLLLQPAESGNVSLSSEVSQLGERHLFKFSDVYFFHVFFATASYVLYRLGSRSAAASSAAISSSVSAHCVAATLSSAWRAFFAPGIGSAPFAITQLRATWLGDLPPCASPISRISLTSGASAARNRRLYIRLRPPGGGFSGVYLPVSMPMPSGLYAIRVMFRSWQNWSRPLCSGCRSIRLYATWLEASGTPRSASASYARRVFSRSKFDTPTVSVSPASTASARPCIKVSMLTTGVGEWIWYRPARSMPSRLRLPRSARTTAPGCVRQGNGKNLVPTTISLSTPLRRRKSPSSRSERPRPYTSAVSKNRTPRLTLISNAVRRSESV